MLEQIVQESYKRARFQAVDAHLLGIVEPRQFLIGNELPTHALCVLVGAPGGGKTFKALDYALTVSQNADALFVDGEGSHGLSARIGAYCEYHQCDAGRLAVVQEAVNLMQKAEVDEFLSINRNRTPTLVVFDTLARCSVGSDEDRARDMGIIVANCDAIRATWNCTVLLVHHPGKNADAGPRGSSSLVAAADTVIQQKRDGDVITISCTKQKDARAFPTYGMELVPYGESMVAVRSERRPQNDAVLDERRLTILRVLAESGDMGTNWSALKRACGVEDTGLQRITKQLKTMGYVHQDGKSKPWSITKSGLEVINNYRTTG